MNYYKVLINLIIFSFFVPCVNAADLSEKLAGKILLQVEKNGEAWYVNPADNKRYFLGRPEDALKIMRDLGIGISNNDLNKIPVNIKYSNGIDSDGDGIPNDLEIALGTNIDKRDSDDDTFTDREELLSGYSPIGNGDMKFDFAFAERHRGKIFLQVEKNGEAWYVNPENAERYFLGRPEDAFQVMRSLGLGITDDNLNSIFASTADYTASRLEMEMFNAVNKERGAESKLDLTWNDELASVAREHSQNLADENEAFVGGNMSCEYPIIHHEGIVFGDYNADRLKNRDIYYFSSAGENIALVPSVSTTVIFKYDDPNQVYFSSCPDRRSEMDQEFKTQLDEEEMIEKKKELIESELEKRQVAFGKEFPLKVDSQNWHTSNEVIEETVQGWMNSPGHRANILEESFDESGIGVATVGGYVISTQVFIKRVGCGYEGGTCCEEEGYLPYCFSGFECKNTICQ